MRNVIASFVVLGGVFSGLVVTHAVAQTPDDYGIAAPGIYCPNLSTAMQRGARDMFTAGQVTELQKFLADYYNVDQSRLISGYFGPITHGYVVQFQREQALPAFGIAGQLTRAKIAAICNQVSATSPTSTYTPGTTQTTATIVPKVEILFPTQPVTISRKGKLSVSWKASTDKRRMITGFGKMISEQKSASGEYVGFVLATGGFMKTIEPGTQYGVNINDFSINDSVPGTYEYHLEIRDCSPKGCDQNPDFPQPGYGPVPTYATSATITYTVVDDDPVAPLSILWKNRSFLIGASYKKELADKLCNTIASVIINPAAVCYWGQQILPWYGLKDGGDYINVLKPVGNDIVQKSSQVLPLEFLDRSAQSGNTYTVYLRTFAGNNSQNIADIIERPLTGIEHRTNNTTAGSVYIGDIPAGDYYLDIINTSTGNEGSLGSYLFVR